MSLVEGLNKKYEGFSITIPRWEISDQGVTALCGPSGSGKTSVFRLLIGLEACPGLKWIHDDVNLADLPVPARELGVVFQSLELFPHMTAAENILFAARARALSRNDAETRLEQLTKELHMENYMARPAHLLSGGEAQRVALARAVIGSPRFLLLDEPFAALDAHLRFEARDLVKNLIDRFQIPTLLITHDEADLTTLANHVVSIENGRLV